MCAPRGKNAGLTYPQIIDKGDFESHCDIVVAKNNNQLEVIGGNVGSSRLCVIIFAYEIVKCLLENTFRTIFLNKLSV
ncbi:DUF2272 domain-containing protein [Microcystis aeruginosa]|uniref:DUF2272 domain-containing protein n=1 Tax=Microcystis aeruginosa TaxID=1126 RepID=UPI001EE95E35|nr:DUF2272 domain-containing protein [Microcystis aeruginosa]